MFDFKFLKAFRPKKSSEDIVQAMAKLTSNLGKHAAESHGVIEDLESAAELKLKLLSEFMVKLKSVAAANEQMTSTIQDLESAITELSRHVIKESQDVRIAKKDAEEFLRVSEEMIQLIVNSGHETEDTYFIELGLKAGKELSDMWDLAVENKEISMGDLFDEEYTPVLGTNPQQYTTRFLEFADKTLQDFLDKYLAAHPRIAGVAAIDRMGYMPTHNRMSSQPQGPNASWNAAHSRQRRMWKDRTAQNSANNERPFLLQTYRRNMGEGQFQMSKDVSVPIMVKGHRWGSLRLVYRVL